MIDEAVSKLAAYALRTGLIAECEYTWAVNTILDALKLDSYTDPGKDWGEIDLAAVLDELLDEFKKYAVEGPQLFPDGMTTDQPDRQVVGEIVREKLLRNLDKEIPHGTAVEITRFIERDDEVIEVDATIYCEKASHKGIIIGKNGAMLKKISTEARQDIERFMGTKVYLETWVKVKENWRDNMNYIRSFGYNDQ